MKLTAAKISTRSFYFGQLVSDYFFAYGFYPTMREMRIGYIYSNRKAGISA